MAPAGLARYARLNTALSVTGILAYHCGEHMYQPCV